MGVTGIGGFFFRSADPKGLTTWYKDVLGVGGEGWLPWEQQKGPTVFAPFKQDSDYFPADRRWMLNLRVEGLDAFLADLRKKGVEVITKAEWNSPEVGKFARVHDPEGNPIELWEPAEI